MADILLTSPVIGNKSARKHKMSDGTTVYDCRSPMNPVYYESNGVYLPINLAAKSDVVSSGSVATKLIAENICSVGLRKDGEASKYLGIRPDSCQDGTEQFEISIDSIIFDGKEISVDLRKMVAVDTITTDLGNVMVRTTRQGCRQMVKVPAPISSFKIQFTVHYKGLDYVKREDLDEEWFYKAASKDFFIRLRKPLLIDDVTYEPLEDTQSFITHSVVDNKDGTLTYTKESTKDFNPDKLPKAYLIDVNTIYSSTADGYITYTNAATFAEARDATTGTSCVNNVASIGNTNSCSFVSTYYFIQRGFFFYSLAGLSGIVTAASENIYGVTNNASTVCTQKGTQEDTLTTADYDAFAGDCYANLSWSKSGYNTFTYNAQGCSDVTAALGGTFKSCTREYGHEYLNSSPAGVYGNGCYFSEQALTYRDPYLSITVAAASGGIRNPFNKPFFGALGGPF